MNTTLDNVNKILSFQKANGIKSTLPNSIVRYKQICLKHGLNPQTTKDLINDKFHHYVNTKTVKQL